MSYKKGSLSQESIEKMRNAKLGKKIGPASEEHKKKIGDALRGRVKEKKYSGVCACGLKFFSGSHSAKFCSIKCRRASYGHGRRHSPEFLCFPKLCAICGSESDLVGDHCHSTGKARGILCRNCNLAIGNMFDNPERLRAAAIYLENNL